MTAETLLSLSGLCAAYAGPDVLHGIDLDVAGHEIVGLAGANGAGKSTLLRALSGTVQLTGGDVKFDGRSIARRPPHARARIGLVHVPEGRELFTDLTVEENLRLGALGAGRAATTDTVLDLFPHLGPRLRQRAGSLSGGEQQMVAIGRGLMAMPRLLLIDELSLGLAPSIAQAIYASLRKLNAGTGLAMVIVDQDLWLLRGLADRVVVLQHGRIVLHLSKGSPEWETEAVNAYLG
jgi:branched-chain amino acid transport system ATP-binding protein